MNTCSVPFLPHTRLLAPIQAHQCECSWKIWLNANATVWVDWAMSAIFACIYVCARVCVCLCGEYCMMMMRTIQKRWDKKERKSNGLVAFFFVMHIAILGRMCLWECILHRAVNGYGSRSISLKQYCCTSKVERGRLRAIANRRRLQTAV